MSKNRNGAALLINDGNVYIHITSPPYIERSEKMESPDRYGNIALKASTKSKLKEIGKFGEGYDDVINRLITVFHDGEQK